MAELKLDTCITWSTELCEPSLLRNVM